MKAREALNSQAIVFIVFLMEEGGFFGGDREVRGEVLVNQAGHVVVDAAGFGVQAVVDVEEEDGAGVGEREGGGGGGGGSGGGRMEPIVFMAW